MTEDAHTAAAPDRLSPMGDDAVFAGFDQGDADAAWRRAQALDAALRDAPPRGLRETTPSLRGVLVQFDPDAVDRAALDRALATPRAADWSPARKRRLTIPCCYAPPHAPDLDQVADEAGLSAAQVVDAHAGATLTVGMLGFMAGFPFMTGLPTALHLPRLSTPRVRVPARSAAIAAGMAAIYPLDGPGGWRLIGRTPLRPFAPDRDPPTLFAPGDEVRFQAISAEEYAALDAAAADGTLDLDRWIAA